MVMIRMYVEEENSVMICDTAVVMLNIFHAFKKNQEKLLILVPRYLIRRCGPFILILENKMEISLFS